MRDDIKKRIETIRRGEVPEDYIRTEFGVMPKEWRKLLVGDVIEFYSEKSTKNNEYPVLTSSRSGLALQTEYFEGQVTREENAGYNIIPYGYCTFRSRSDDGRRGIFMSAGCNEACSYHDVPGRLPPFPRSCIFPGVKTMTDLGAAFTTVSRTGAG